MVECGAVRVEVVVVAVVEEEYWWEAATVADREESMETWVWAAAWEVGAVWEVGVGPAANAIRGEARSDWDGWDVWGVRGEGAAGLRLCPRCVWE